jgi:hypothetical protein
MVVKPMAGDRLEDNLNPVGRTLLRGFEDGLRADLAVAAGCAALGRKLARHFARLSARATSRASGATETPFNMVLEARP